MTTPLLRRIRRHAERHTLWSPGARVVAALSGGSDSAAQLFLLRELEGAGELTLVGAAHLNHRLRPTADRDETFCRTLCHRLGVPLVAEAADVGRLAAGWRCSPEVAARRARHAFFARACEALRAHRVAVAHTLDDQAETVLLRLLRGAGTHGLRGIPPSRGVVVRPVLVCTRSELRADLTTRGESWTEDETNLDVAHARNRVRHELIPLLTSRFQPAVARILARTADVAAAEDALLESLADAVAVRAVTAKGTSVHVSIGELAAAPLALRRRVARGALDRVGARRSADLADVDRLLAVATSRGPAAADVAGVRVERFSADSVLLSGGGASRLPSLAERPLSVPGVVYLPEIGAGCRIAAERPITPASGLQENGSRAVLRADVAAPLIVRARRPGDRLSPVGLGGSKKLQDLLVDRKVPRRLRDQVPVVTDAAGRVVWVAGHAVDAAAAAKSGASDVIVLTFDQPAVTGSEGS
jgi:tRNA(Ile)-lysidine synthase